MIIAGDLQNLQSVLQTQGLVLVASQLTSNEGENKGKAGQKFLSIIRLVIGLSRIIITDFSLINS